MKLKRPLARQTLARQLNVTVETLRYQERAGRFKPTKKTDEVGRPLVMYSDEEIRKAIEYYNTRDFKYKTDAAHVR